jgi:hypothetical protein
VSWRGDGSFYDGFSTAWRMQPSGGAPHDFSFTQWKGLSAVRDNATDARIGWSKLLQNTARAVHDYLPSDFVLRLDSPAIGAAPDESDSGARLERLPSIPKRGAVVRE